MGLKEDIAKLITDASAAIGKPMVEGVDFEMFYQPLHHKPAKLPDGKIAVYTFYYNNQFLKIGKSVNTPRYQSNHYHRANRKGVAHAFYGLPNFSV